ncbi:hypothetical protein CY0110_17072 [Crocosphaera chwakensis CCY0110]|uniref:Uncharacterized protein n=1 Tax=Crocosphaera chwakensis CCY0110 TaxID=391612 RepID=A3II96_9CHRO|nr:hypothetical protein CY0110_17072 [Crocosphaera chwakensis CCY0110]
MLHFWPLQNHHPIQMSAHSLQIFEQFLRFYPLILCP